MVNQQEHIENELKFKRNEWINNVKLRNDELSNSIKKLREQLDLITKINPFKLKGIK